MISLGLTINNVPRCHPCRHGRPRLTRVPRAQITCRAAPHTYDLVTFTLIIDDIVYWDGTTAMAQLGGGGSQTLWGYQACAAANGIPTNVALAAGFGSDLPQKAKKWLEMNGVDLSGLVMHSNESTPRAWQILEKDGRRHEIWRTQQSEQQARMLLPSLEALPLELRSPRAFHLGVHPEHPPLELMRALRQNLGPDGILSVETFTKAEAPLSDGDLKAVVSLSTIFSPNEEEALSMLNRMQHSIDELKLDRQPWLMTTPFIQAGAGWVVIRRGPKGAVVHDAATDSLWDVPAVSNLNVRDFTGCGNAFCGAFLAAVQAGSPGGEAAAWGCAAGSAMAEARGVPWVPVRDTAPLIRSRAENLIAKKLVRR